MNNIRNFCIIAHIDHGKSTLADRMMEITDTIAERDMKAQLLDQMDLERERGITIKLAPVRMLYKNFILNLIDTPGHVDFSYEVSRSLAAVEGAILLVDATQGVQAQTLANLHLAEKNNLTIIPVINKIDLAGADIEETEREIKKLLGDEINILRVSAKTGAGVEDLLDEIVAQIPSPVSHSQQPTTNNQFLRALVFDSIWDRHRGVIAYVRVVDGEIKKGDKIQFFATKATDEAFEVGTFSPKFTPSDRLRGGEIGYIITGLKNVSEARVGDTIIMQNANLKSQNVEPLPGYKDPQPMVFASFYTVGGEADELREALAKLKLNDASLSFETERSLALGAGFRCGFLGMLHLEIVKERLEREYNLDLIVTAPQVNYKKVAQNYEEPWVKLEIITPEEYLGSIMQELASRRARPQSATADSFGGQAKYIDYMGDRVKLTYEAPLAEIIIDFYDELKSISAGYASMNYELIDYRGADLEQLEILIAEEKVEAFSQLMDKSKIGRRAREIVKKLKDLLPRQMFEVKIQAVAGNRIIASERISALRKDVTAKLYGGDVTRKNKLLKKQAKGKKKMRQLGRVQIPSEVFVRMLR